MINIYLLQLILKSYGRILEIYLPTAEELIVVVDNGTEIFNSGKSNYIDIRKIPSFSENDSSSRINEDRATLKIIEGNFHAVSYPINVGSHV